MSEAKSPKADIFSINVCSQCLHVFQRSTMRDARHAVPCGHVLCKDCVGRIEAEQKSDTPVCRKAGCGKQFGPISEFAAAWCAQRADRIATQLGGLFRDQGDVGDAPEAPEAEPALNLCAKHKCPFKGVDQSTHRPMCAECNAASGSKILSFDEAIAALETASNALVTSAEFARHKARLAETPFTPDEFRSIMAKWAVRETARIKAWEKREVKHVKAVSAEAAQMVEETCARLIEISASLTTQRACLRASLEELEQALADLPKDPVSRFSRRQALYTEQKQLCELLVKYGHMIPSARSITEWTAVPTLSGEFGEFDEKTSGKGAAHASGKGGGALAQAVSGAAKAALHRICSRPLGLEAGDWRSFPVIPELVR